MDNWTIFAIIILTDPNTVSYTTGCGRVIQNIQLSAWDNGIGSGLYTGIREIK
ncbi:MAG: hypothetical protein P0116_13880 [Candidatus Nitrosocosmicus sp.]|nr:hypothetical protein [Candidatus Nitrosocosmicus sp.]